MRIKTKHTPPTMMPIRAGFLKNVSVYITQMHAGKAYGRFEGPLSLLGAFPGDTRPDAWVVWARLFEVEGGTVTLGPPCVHLEFVLGWTFCIAEVSLRTVPVAGSVLSYKNIKACPWGTEVCHSVLLPVDTPSLTTFNLKATPPGT